MSERQTEGLEPVLRELRKPVRFSASFNTRVLEAVRAVAAQPMRLVVGLSPIPQWRMWTAFAAVAAGVVALLVVPAIRKGHPQHVQFVLVAPEAKTVKVVGDFNGWNTAHPAFDATNRGGGVWSVTAPVTPGYHRYAFLVDDSLWVSDPAAPRAGDDDAGNPNSAIVVEDQP